MVRVLTIVSCTCLCSLANFAQPDRPRLAAVGTEGCIGVVEHKHGHFDRFTMAVNNEWLVYRLIRDHIDVPEEFDDKVNVVDLGTGKEAKRLADPDHKGAARLFLAPDGRHLIVDHNDAVFVWDLQSGTRIRRCEGIKGTVQVMALSPDGRSLAAKYSAMQGPGLPLLDHGLCLWEVATGKFLYSFQDHPHRQFAVAFSRVTNAWPRPWLLRVDRDRSETEEWYNAFLWDILETEAKSGLINQLGIPHRQPGLPHQQPIAVETRLEQLGGVPGFRVCRGYPNCSLFIPPAPATALAARKNEDGSITLYDRWTDKEVKRLAAFPPKYLHYVWITPNGRRVIGIGSERVGEKKFKGRLFIWDTSKEHAELAKLRPEFTVEELKSLWKDLTDLDARVAQRAACLLARNPEVAIAYLRERLTPVPWPEGWPGDRRFATTIAQLEDDKPAVREQAERLLYLHNMSWDLLQNLVKAERLSADAQRRMAPLLNELTERSLTPTEHRRYLWSIELLERLATAEAKELLGRLARGHQGAWITWEAQYALARLGVDTRVLNAVDGSPLWPAIWGWPRF